MARFDVFPDPDGYGWPVDLQSDLLDGLNTTVVAPLLPRERAPRPADRLNPIIIIDGTEHLLVPQFMAAVPRAILKNRKTNLIDRAADIANAVDMVFVGF